MALKITQSTVNPTLKWKILKNSDEEAGSDHIIQTKVVDPVVLAILAYENKPINVAILSDVRNSLS